MEQNYWTYLEVGHSHKYYYFITKNLSLCTEATDASSGFGCLLTSSVGV